MQMGSEDVEVRVRLNRKTPVVCVCVCVCVRVCVWGGSWITSICFTVIHTHAATLGYALTPPDPPRQPLICEPRSVFTVTSQRPLTHATSYSFGNRLTYLLRVDVGAASN